jgi:hypothetical protein
MLYDPGSISLTVLGVSIYGYQKGTFIKAERNAKTYSQEVGSQGDVTSVRSLDKSGKINFTLQQESTCNDLLSSLMASSELVPTVYGTTFAKDSLGTTRIMAAVSRLEGWPAVEFADSATGREWVVLCNDLEPNVGGGVVPG